MRKFLLGLLCGLVLAFVFVVVFAFSLVRFAERRPPITASSVLTLRLEGDLPERAPVEIPLPSFESQSSLTIRDIWAMLQRAASDSRIKAVVVAPRRLTVGWAKLEEIRQSLEQFKKSGKPVYALLRFPNTRDYYIATAAARIYASPEDLLDLKGLRIEAMYFRDTLKKLGVRMDVVHAGKYKDAYDVFTRTSMSPETREVLNQILDQYYSDLVGTIAAGRNKGADSVRALIDMGPFVAKDALANGLIDALGYEDSVISELKGRLKQPSLKTLDCRNYLRSLGPDAARTKIAFVVAQGAIMQGAGSGLGSEDTITSGAIARMVRQVKSDTSIKGVLIRIDSPGGDSIASEDILHELKELGRSKPVVVSMSDVAASGGYYMAVTGAPIVAYPNTITGSIGVITAKPDLKGLYDKIGISKELLTRGRFAALDSDYGELSDAERAKVGESVDAIYRGFIRRVAEGRHRSFEEIASVAQGRVWVGTQARDRGLVDQLGGLDTAVALIRQKAKIPPGEAIALVPYPPRRSLFDLLMSRSDEAGMAEAKLNLALSRIPGGRWIRPLLGGGPLAVMPYSVEVR
jgi:protease-4